jgi:hypothetical protein
MPIDTVSVGAIASVKGEIAAFSFLLDRGVCGNARSAVADVIIEVSIEAIAVSSMVNSFIVQVIHRPGCVRCGSDYRRHHRHATVRREPQMHHPRSQDDDDEPPTISSSQIWPGHSCGFPYVSQRTIYLCAIHNHKMQTMLDEEQCRLRAAKRAIFLILR